MSRNYRGSTQVAHPLLFETGVDNRVAKTKAKTVAVLEPAVDDFCYLIAQSAVALMDQSKTDDLNAAPQNQSEDCQSPSSGEQS